MSSSLDPTDLFALDADFTEAQRAVAARVRGFVDAEVLPCIAEFHDREESPRHLLPGLAKLGLLELLLEAKPDPTAYGLAMRELERGSSTVRSIYSVQGGLVLHAVNSFGSDEHRTRWLQPLVKLESLACFCLTEPNFGSNPAGMETRAEPTADGYRVNGHKRWATNGVVADLALVWAKLDDRVCGFLIETDRPGMDMRPIKGKVSFRTSESSELLLHDVEIPKTALLPGARSLGAAMACLNNARYSIAWGVVGAAQACIEETIAYLAQRIQFDGKSIASHQLVQYKLAWMAAELTSMQLVAKRLGELKAQGKEQPAQISLAKMNNCRKAIEIARTCRELLGAHGVLTASHVMRRMVDLETVITYEGTEHIHALIVGSELTGIKAFS
ncbi:MAG: acyl-CoA dehydrogenase family protein [Candidatus Hydrogenedentes bacterium]|nr:acyl-CoA dehydrogenase family protein [Candidatus Hydrogenedentota bacterium]